ncbi:uncharacterized protein LOC126831603 [Patella vulgata]|uniref:uncharacterized protein LOC126831603 n=1 Tax=Patella vulgata TaxID=6465 RepID=UPI0024A83ADA|nr:uncharacterized protein LOC126831603 [Patella vulgata]
MASSKVDKVLKLVVVGCGIGALSGAFYYTEKVQGQFRREEFYTKPMKLLRNYEPAKEHLGEPIRSTHIDLGNTTENNIDGLNAKLTIPIKGSKDKGKMYVTASRNEAGESWIINQLDLEIKRTRRKWTFYKTPETTDS